MKPTALFHIYTIAFGDSSNVLFSLRTGYCAGSAASILLGRGQNSNSSFDFPRFPSLTKILASRSF